MSEFYHRPVMLGEVIDGLSIKPGGVYFDGTVGGGGHAFSVLEKEKSAYLIGTDRDGDAIAAATERLKPFAGRFELYRTNYKNYQEVFDRAGADRLDGVLLDLGISSHQIDDETRGFSYLRADAPLDMRMDTTSSLTAFDVVNGYEETRLVRILRDFGEERFAVPIVKNLIRERAKRPIETCGRLAKIVEESLPFRLRSPACARQTFQAVRIEVNGELEGLSECVTGLCRRLKQGGRICILTFHSLEDRIVKNAFRDLSIGCTCPKSFPVCVCGKTREIAPVGRQPIFPSEQEKEENPRSRSAKLRIAQKL